MSLSVCHETNSHLITLSPANLCLSCLLPLDICTGGAIDSVVPVDMITDPTQNNIFNRPVVQTVPALPGVGILAQ